MNRLLPALLLGCALSACASSSPRPAARALPADARVILMHDDASRVLTYVSSSWGFSTNSFFLEGPTGLVMVDVQFLPSAALEAVQWAEMATGKKVELAVVLHANPDKFNGTEVLQKRGIKVVTSQQVLDVMPAIHEKRTRAFLERYQPDYPTTLPRPDAFGSTTTTLTAGGLTLKAHVMGPGVSEAHVVVEWEKHVFVGDLVANGSHSWLEIGKTPEWLARLDEIEALEPEHVHCGRGFSGDARLLQAERAYLKTVMAEVAAEKPVRPVNDDALTRIKERLEARYVGYRFAVFLEIGLPAEWKRQAALGAAPAPTP